MTPDEARAAFASLPPVEQIPAEVILPVLIKLSALQAALTTRLLIEGTPHSPPDQRDELLTVNQAAARMAVSADYLYRHHGKLPFTVRQGRILRFSSIGLNRYLEKRRGR